MLGCIVRDAVVVVVVDTDEAAAEQRYLLLESKLSYLVLNKAKVGGPVQSLGKVNRSDRCCYCFPGVGMTLHMKRLQREG
jgi:hypothetical protein